MGSGPGIDPETCWACGLAWEPNVLICWSGILLFLKPRPSTNAVGTIVGTPWESGGSFWLVIFTCLCDRLHVDRLLCHMSVLGCICGIVFIAASFLYDSHILKSFFLNIHCKPCQIFTTGGWTNYSLFIYVQCRFCIFLSTLLEICCNFLDWLVYLLQEVISISF